MNQLATINVASAALPATYEAAKNALAECASIDECQDWADKAAALASYARQAEDDQLERMSQRIRARAIRRAGELLKQIEPGHGKNQNIKDGNGPNAETRKAVGEQAGMSERQIKTAIRVANIPQDVFDTCIEDDKPATVTELAEMGKKDAPKPLIDIGERNPSEFNKCVKFIGTLNHHLRDLREFDVEEMASILTPSEAARVKEAITALDAIHDQIFTRV